MTEYPSGQDLSGHDLSGADLRHANLTGHDLSGANLTGADLRDANLTGVNLRGATTRDTVWPEGFSPEKTSGVANGADLGRHDRREGSRPAQE